MKNLLSQYLISNPKSHICMQNSVTELQHQEQCLKEKTEKERGERKEPKKERKRKEKKKGPAR